MNLIWQNARIESVFCGQEHGCPTVTIQCRGDAWGQGFGGRALVDPDAMRNFVAGVCAVLDIPRLQIAVGGFVRVGREAPVQGCGPSIIAIRPIVSDWPIFLPGNDLALEPGVYGCEEWIKKFGPENRLTVGGIP